jgi:hypothetical protein
VALASSALAQGQVHDLRISSVIWPELNDIPRRSLVVGLSQTRAALEAQAQASGLN